MRVSSPILAEGAYYGTPASLALGSDRNGSSPIRGMTVSEMGAGRLIFLDGRATDDPATSISEQMHFVLATIERRLTDTGALPLRILSVRIDLADVSDYQEAIGAWVVWAGAGRVTARAIVGFLEEPSGPLVEVTLVAAFQLDRRSRHRTTAVPCVP